MTYVKSTVSIDDAGELSVANVAEVNPDRPIQIEFGVQEPKSALHLSAAAAGELVDQLVEALTQVGAHDGYPF